ncbi:VanZ family protein, partial [Sinorhizobium meliloti]
AVKVAGAGCGVGAGWLLVSLLPGSSRKSRA